MSKRYAIWDKKSPVVTPSGEVFTAEQWIERYPVAALPNFTILCAPGEINGALFGTLGQLKEQYINQGYSFDDCENDQAILDKIEALEDEINNHIEEEDSEPSAAELTAAALTSIAASMEFQNMMSLDDIEVEG